jgi:hypothetical protein
VLSILGEGGDVAWRGVAWRGLAWRGVRGEARRGVVCFFLLTSQPRRE